MGLPSPLKPILIAGVADGGMTHAAFCKIVERITRTMMHIPMAFSILPVFMLGFMTRFYGPVRTWSEALLRVEITLHLRRRLLLRPLYFIVAGGPWTRTAFSSAAPHRPGILIYGTAGLLRFPETTWDSGPHERDAS